MSVVTTKDQTWLDLLHETYQTISQSPSPVYVTLTSAIEDDIHPLGLVSGAKDSFFWVTPDRRTFISAAGIVTSFQATGPLRFRTLQQELRSVRFISNHTSLSSPYGQGPLLYGGFAFAPIPDHKPGPWANFPDGLLNLPSFAVIRHEGVSWLSQTIQLDPSQAPQFNVAHEDLRALADRLESERACVLRKLRDYHVTHQERRQGTGQAEASQPDADLPSIAFDEEEIQHWTRAVEELTKEAQKGRVIKTVLSRHVDISLPAPIVIDRLLARLEAEHPQSFIFAVTRNGRTFLGATPERLLQVEDRNFRSEALAGSTRRGNTESEDILLAHQLLSSEKERHEQQVVLEWIVNRLKKWCSSLETPGTPSVVRFPKVQHLHTPITGVLHKSTHILQLVEAIHPTPAVGGYPLDTALSLIATYEEESRGWYAGPVGWVNPMGSGEFAVGIRSALIDEHTARLFAGCGIVDGSDPRRELAEARLKLGVIFDSLVRALS